EDNTTIDTNKIQVSFIANDNREITSCNLKINNIIVKTNTNIEKGIENIIEYETQEDEIINWNITCIDNSNNIGVSQSKSLNIDSNDYQITTCLELQKISLNATGHYELMNDVECENDFEPITSLTGSFNGKGNTISNVYINKTDDYDDLISDYVSLFRSNSGTIQNVNVDGNIFGSCEVGGITGRNGGTIQNVSFVGNVYSGKTCTRRGNPSWSYVGGIAGWNLGTIRKSFVEADVNGRIGGMFTGGIAGENVGLIENSFAKANVAGFFETGGIIGRNYNNKTIRNTYSSSTFDGVGTIRGLVGGSNAGSIIENSYFDLNIYALTVQPNETAYAKTTIEMKQQATFVDWNFDDIWSIEEENDYPYLK
ncbi:MAG: hypothetical protein PHY80_06430, partial [Rickettsiales bacterium]|nr:hypothetical protein [Rickettsiales bacterium]